MLSSAERPRPHNQTQCALATPLVHPLSHSRSLLTRHHGRISGHTSNQVLCPSTPDRFPLVLAAPHTKQLSGDRHLTNHGIGAKRPCGLIHATSESDCPTSTGVRCKHRTWHVYNAPHFAWHPL